MKNISTGILFLILAGITFNSAGQSYELSKASSTIIISGTSSLHDWEMDLKTFNCEVVFITNGTDLKGIESLVFNSKTTDLKSHNALMDKKAYAALKAEAFPEIGFKLASASVNTSGNSNFSGNLIGNLSVAGKSKIIILPFKGKLTSLNQKQKIEVLSIIELAMSDFEITPPTAMMGALKTGDKIKISLSIQFISN